MEVLGEQGVKDASEVNNKSSNSFLCTVVGCNASFRKLWRLKIHVRQHTGERPFVCDVSGCNKSYTNAMHLKRHKNVVHEALEELMCDVPGCGMVLCSRENLKKHHSRIHDSNNLPYKCAECDESFKKKRLLRKHLDNHFPERNYMKCDTCNIVFSHKWHYMKHCRTHKSYECDCGTSFDRWSKFCEHRKICSIKRIDHKCTICGKVFTTSSNLKAHALVHVEESKSEVYRCVYLNCNRSYKYKKNLTFHVKHFHEEGSADVTIKCTFPGCSVLLKSKKNLKQHLANMHSDKPKCFKPRRRRKDKGVPKRKMIDYLSGVSNKTIVNIMNSCHSNTNNELPNDNQDNCNIENITKLEESLIESQEEIDDINFRASVLHIPNNEIKLDEMISYCDKDMDGRVSMKDKTSPILETQIPQIVVK